MKMIKKIVLVSICLTGTTFLHAQEIKTEVLKQTEVKPPAASVASNMPSPASELKPMNGITPKEAPIAATEAPSPLKKEVNKTQHEEQLKTLNGTPEKLKQMAPPTTPDAPQNIKPAILLVPAPAPPIIKNEKQ